MKNILSAIILATTLTACATGTMVKDPGLYKTEVELMQQLGKPQSVVVASNGQKILIYTMVGIGRTTAASFTVENGVVQSYTYMDM